MADRLAVGPLALVVHASQEAWWWGTPQLMRGPAGRAPVLLNWLRRIVGGNIEAIAPTRGFHDAVTGWHAYCNEEGKLLALPLNGLGTSLARAAGWRVDDVIAGALVFLGDDTTGAGGEADVPAGLLTLCTRLGLVIDREEAPRA